MRSDKKSGWPSLLASITFSEPQFCSGEPVGPQEQSETADCFPQDGRGACLVCLEPHPHHRSWFDNGYVSRWDEGRGFGAPCRSLHTLKRKQEEEKVFVFLSDITTWGYETQKHLDVRLQMKSGERRAQGCGTGACGFHQPSPVPTGPSSSPPVWPRTASQCVIWGSSTFIAFYQSIFTWHKTRKASLKVKFLLHTPYFFLLGKVNTLKKKHTAGTFQYLYSCSLNFFNLYLFWLVLFYFFSL